MIPFESLLYLVFGERISESFFVLVRLISQIEYKLMIHNIFQNGMARLGSFGVRARPSQAQGDGGVRRTEDFKVPIGLLECLAWRP